MIGAWASWIFSRADHQSSLELVVRVVHLALVDVIVHDAGLLICGPLVLGVRLPLVTEGHHHALLALHGALQLVADGLAHVLVAGRGRRKADARVLVVYDPVDAQKSGLPHLVGRVIEVPLEVVVARFRLAY